MSQAICPSSIKILSILAIVAGTTLILTGIGTMVGAFSQIPGDSEGMRVFRFAVARYLILGAVSIVLASGLFEGKRWAWFGALVLSVLALIKFPVGTLIGLAVSVCLLQRNVRVFFKIGSHPPPPS